MQIGLVGTPYSGKTTLFNLLTGNNQATGFNEAGEIHIGSAVVPDPRIGFLSNLYKPKKTTYARIDFKDIPGVKMDDNRARASHLLNEVRSSDMLVQVVRAYNSDQTNALVGSSQPYSELVDYATELILADIDALEKRIERIDDMKKKNNDSLEQQNLLRKLLAALEEEIFIGTLELTDSEKELLMGQSFLSEKPMLIVVNIDEDQLRCGNYPQKDEIYQYAAEKGIPLVEVCAKTEMEINQLEPNEQSEFLDELGLTESSLGRLARTAYELLHLSSFFTVGEDEVRAWTIKHGNNARKAAGKIHSDIERGFIRAEVFHYNFLYELGSTVKVREAGQFRLEGKEYEVVDGDIISFRFNV